MSDDKAITIGFTACLLGAFVLMGHGCAVVERGNTERYAADRAAQTATQHARSKAPTAVTCVEHSVLDRVQVVQ